MNRKSMTPRARRMRWRKANKIRAELAAQQDNPPLSPELASNSPKSPKKKAHKNLTCLKCGKGKLSNLKYHQNNFCPVTLGSKHGLPCSKCSLRLKSLPILKRHHLHIHLEVASKEDLNLDKWTCGQCGVHWTTRQSLYVHLESHKDNQADTKYTCKLCSKVFQTQVVFRQHQTISCPNIKPEICERCGKTFKNQNTLKGHQKSSCGALEREPNFECKVCKKKFVSASFLRKHSRLHNRAWERPYVCTKCGGSFRVSNHLRRHEQGCDGSKKPRKPRWSNMAQPASTSAAQIAEGDQCPGAAREIETGVEKST